MIRRIEQGQAIPRPRNIEALARGLGVSPTAIRRAVASAARDAPSKVLDSTPESRWWRESCKKRSELKMPGYWSILEDNCIRWARELKVCSFWTEATQSLKRWRTEYRNKTGYALLSTAGLPGFQAKKAKRIRTKLDERASEDEGFEAFPESGPPVPVLEDLVRTRISCAYLDGVEFLASKLEELARPNDPDVKREWVGSLEGYFAQHLYVHEEVFYKVDRINNPVTITFEIQVATELATSIWNAKHLIYEQVRGRGDSAENWQWNPRDAQFISNQLGHMVHLADGLLVQLRDAVSSSAERRGRS